MGDIGKPNKEIEFEPFPATEPLKEPAVAPEPVPAEPVPAGV
jgi:hypothetical protein